MIKYILLFKYFFLTAKTTYPYSQLWLRLEQSPQHSKVINKLIFIVKYKTLTWRITYICVFKKIKLILLNPVSYTFLIGDLYITSTLYLKYSFQNLNKARLQGFFLN
jgi:hypothetical protein